MVDMRPTFFSRKNSRVGPPATHIFSQMFSLEIMRMVWGFALGGWGVPRAWRSVVFLRWMRSRHGGVLADAVDIELFKVYVLKSLQWFSLAGLAVDFERLSSVFP